MLPDERKSAVHRQAENVKRCKASNNSMREQDNADEYDNNISEIKSRHCEGLEDKYKNSLFETQQPMIRWLQGSCLCWHHVSGNTIPLIVVLARLIISTANGFTADYIQSYFVSEVGISQTTWDIVCVVSPFIIIVGYFTCAVQAAWNARIQVIFLSYVSGLIFLFVLVLLNALWDKMDAYISLPLYILHFVFMQRVVSNQSIAHTYGITYYWD